MQEPENSWEPDGRNEIIEKVGKRRIICSQNHYSLLKETSTICSFFFLEKHFQFSLTLKRETSFGFFPKIPEIRCTLGSQGNK